jgi:hypothetical protein
MNFQGSTSSSLLLTASLTQWPEYQLQERSVGANSFRHWQNEQQLHVQSLYHVSKVQQVIQAVLRTIEQEKLFAYLSEEIEGEDILEKRRKIVHVEANKLLFSYQSQTQGLLKNIVQMTKEVEETAHDPTSLKKKEKTILSQLKQTCEILGQLREQVQVAKQELKSSPLAKDKRCLKKNIKPFQKTGFDHPTYAFVVKAWQERGQLASNALEEDCWKWKGKVKAIQILESDIAHLANSLHAVECCLFSLQANANNPSFYPAAFQATGLKGVILGLRLLLEKCLAEDREDREDDDYPYIARMMV